MQQTRPGFARSLAADLSVRRTERLRMMRVAVVLVLVVGGLVGLAGCAGKVSYSPLVTVNRPARPADQIEAYLTDKPPREYQEIGILTYRAGSTERYTSVVRYMREKAGRLGADGIIMLGSSSGPRMSMGGQFISVHTDYRAKAIVYAE
jgi:hypothetical protein